ncbi:Dynein light chain-related protein [Penicillium chermesinum]|uniref:Dynein light chain-related protein n=1 Tax=Penicillium chermesinum TaxID=63820 RepID=A0A9W9U0M5_9EURO|nr:Dynein light chain-related protein [Penicillium chermesinum]KAJ5249231.1 Dynein light chain-related protein [Penicillium chermesinum]KAJ6151323.1 Dynein light chain-related protein [Penicillium chermesinum]
MATQRLQQVPQHVTALLSHLTSRPGVQSTLILSRKDGSIIQSTGELAFQETSQSRLAQPATSTTDSTSPLQTTDSGTTDSAPKSPTYQPSQAEALAAHIFAFVSSASALGMSLSNPGSQTQNSDSSSRALDSSYDTYGNGTGTSTPREEDRDSHSYDREEDGEVKLLRMRTKKHEIVVVPDRKYLLCVVHDASGNGPSANGARTR